MDENVRPREPADTPSDHDLLRQYLADRDAPCPACGYNLRQLQCRTCPECGRELILTVGVIGLSNLWITALVGALVPAACGLPLHLVLLIALSHGATLSELVSEPAGVGFLLLDFYALACALASVLLLVMRQRFMRLRVQVQSTIAYTLVLAAVIGALVVLALIGSL